MFSISGIHSLFQGPRVYYLDYRNVSNGQSSMMIQDSVVCLFVVVGGCLVLLVLVYLVSDSPVDVVYFSQSVSLKFLLYM